MRLPWRKLSEPDERTSLLFAEQFAMNEHISKGCGVLANFGGDCKLQVDELIFFTSAEYGCNEDGINVLQFAGYNEDTPDSVTFLIETVNPTCYNSLTDFHQMFIS